MTSSATNKNRLLEDSFVSSNPPIKTLLEPILHMSGCPCSGCRAAPVALGPAIEDSPDDSGASGHPGSLSQMANYLKTGFWSDWDISHRNFNLSSTGLHAKNGIISYNTNGNIQDGDGLIPGRIDLVDEAFKLFKAILGIDFQATTSNRADINFADNESGAFTLASVNGSTTDVATINIASDWHQGSNAFDDYTFQTILHEIGHGLGLGHQGLYNASGSYSSDADFTNDSWQSSMMSYFSQSDNTSVEAGFAFLSTPMVVDWIALDQIYAARGFGITNAFQGDTTYGFNTTIPATTSRIFNQLAELIPSTAFTLVDGGGNDTLDFSRFFSNQLIDLRDSDESASNVYSSNIAGNIGNLTIAPGTIIERAIGGSGNDIFRGNGANNTLDGGDGTDTVLLNGAPSDYSMSYSDGSLILQDLRSGQPDGTNTLINIESFHFNGETLSRSDLLDQLDITPPTILLSSNASSLRTGQTASISFSLSEASTDFTQADISLSGASLSNWTPHSPTSYSATLRPNNHDKSIRTISVESGTFSDAAGNFNIDGDDLDNALLIDTREIQPASFVIKGTPRSGRTFRARRTDSGAEIDGVFRHVWQLAFNQQAWSTVNAGNSFRINDQHAGASIRLITTYATPHGIEEIQSDSRTIPHAPLEIATAAFRRKTLTLKAEGELGLSRPKARRFQVTLGDQTIPVRSTSVEPTRDSITLKLARAIDPVSVLGVSYKDRQGDQITGVIENASGLDLKSFQTMVVRYAQATVRPLRATNGEWNNRDRTSEREAVMNHRRTSRKHRHSSIEAEPLALQDQQHFMDSAPSTVRHATSTELVPSNDPISELLKGHVTGNPKPSGMIETSLC